MQKFDVNKIIISLEKKGIALNSDFLKSSASELAVPILDQMNTLLNGIDAKGLKLTAKGNLPTALVKNITLVNPSYEEQRYIHLSQRFIEDESMSAQRARVLAKNLKFITISKNKLFLTPKAKAYQTLSSAEKFVILFESFLTLNFGYFDRHESFDLLNQLAPLYLHTLRDRESLYRSVPVYDAFFFETHSDLKNLIFQTLLNETSISLNENAPDMRKELDRAVEEKFNTYIQLRLFERFFALFGLIEERGNRYNKELSQREPYEAQKTPLLDKFIHSLNEVDTNLLINKKIVYALQKEIKEKKLNIEDLFYDFAYLMSTLGNYPLSQSSLVVDDMMQQKMIIGTEATKQAKLYTDFYEGLKVAIFLFTQTEVKGANREALNIQFREFIDAIYLLVDRDKKPFMIYKQLESLPSFMFELLSKEYGISIEAGNFEDVIVKQFNLEVSEDIGMLFSHLSHLQKQSKKLKRVTKEYVSLLKDTVQSYVLAIFSLYTYQLENRVEQGIEMAVPQSDGFVEKVFEFKITLRDITPEIYRVVQVPSNFTFYDLHSVIQSAFNWENSHLFEFIIKKRVIADHEDEFDEEDILVAKEILLDEEFKRKSQKGLYIYDFGDNWEHEIVLQNTFTAEKGKKYPYCIDAKGNTPPEDVGGVWGFENFKNIMRDKSHPEYMEMREWYDHEYDEDDCSVTRINKKFF